jgi:hypothetical protein
MIAVCLQFEIIVSVVIMSRGRNRTETQDQRSADRTYRATSNIHD